MKKQARILVVDQSSTARIVLTKYLKKSIPDAVVDSADSGTKARELLDQQEQPYDLVSTSLMLSGLDGLDLCKYIRSHHLHQYTPVIIVSSDADETLEMKGFSVGVSEYFDKSQGNEALAEFIKGFLQRNRGNVGTVLYVEDSRTTATQGKRIMTMHGLNVTHLTSAEECIQYLDGLDKESLPDIVVTDFMLDGNLTGGDLLNHIRAKRHLSAQDLPVLVVTGDASMHAEVLLRGANDFIEKPFVEEILIARIKSFILVKQVFAALNKQTELMREMAITDSLTGTRNKRYLLDYGDEFLKDPGGQPVSLFISDIDHFKKINDTKGHLAGDKVLSAMGNLLNEIFSDKKRYMVCRFGGEEFTVLMKDAPREIAENLCQEFRVRVSELSPNGIDITTSVGCVGTDTRPGKSLSEYMALADEALYACKEGGRNCVHYAADSGMERVV